MQRTKYAFLILLPLTSPIHAQVPTDASMTTKPCHGSAAIWYYDKDEDGWGDPDVSITSCDQPLHYVTNNYDCDDTDKDSEICVTTFFAIADGNWRDGSVWSYEPGGLPINYYPRAEDEAVIAGHHIIVDNEVTCGEIKIGNDPQGRLEVTGKSGHLIVNGNITIQGSSAAYKRLLMVNNFGKIECKTGNE